MIIRQVRDERDRRVGKPVARSHHPQAFRVVRFVPDIGQGPRVSLPALERDPAGEPAGEHMRPALERQTEVRAVRDESLAHDRGNQVAFTVGVERTARLHVDHGVVHQQVGGQEIGRRARADRHAPAGVDVVASPPLVEVERALPHVDAVERTRPPHQVRHLERAEPRLRERRAARDGRVQAAARRERGVLRNVDHARARRGIEVDISRTDNRVSSARGADCAHGVSAVPHGNGHVGR